MQTAAVATGIGNTLGNKGGVALGCSVGSTSLLFVNVHLSAHQVRVRVNPNPNPSPNPNPKPKPNPNLTLTSTPSHSATPTTTA